MLEYTKKNAVTRTALDPLGVLLVETAGIEPASASTLQAVLHTYPCYLV